MPAAPKVDVHHASLLLQLGERLRLMRLRRGMTAEAAARLAGTTRTTLHRLEAGQSAATLGTLVKVLAVLGAGHELDLLCRDDRYGRERQDAQLRARRLPSKIKLQDLPQLREAAWHLSGTDVELSPKEVFELYERNWRHIDSAAMDANEAGLLERLKKSVGKGVLLV